MSTQELAELFPESVQAAQRFRLLWNERRMNVEGRLAANGALNSSRRFLILGNELCDIAESIAAGLASDVRSALSARAAIAQSLAPNEDSVALVQPLRDEVIAAVRAVFDSARSSALLNKSMATASEPATEKRVLEAIDTTRRRIAADFAAHVAAAAAAADERRSQDKDRDDQAESRKWQRWANASTIVQVATTLVVGVAAYVAGRMDAVGRLWRYVQSLFGDGGPPL